MDYFCCRSFRIYEQNLSRMQFRRSSFWIGSYSEIYQENLRKTISEKSNFKVGSSEFIDKSQRFFQFFFQFCFLFSPLTAFMRIHQFESWKWFNSKCQYNYISCELLMAIHLLIWWFNVAIYYWNIENASDFVVEVFMGRLACIKVSYHILTSFFSHN